MVNNLVTLSLLGKERLAKVNFITANLVFSSLRYVSQRKVQLHAVLVSAESSVSRISLRKRNSFLNHFSLSIKGYGGPIHEIKNRT